ncbi:hypothetical protein WG899_10550 [Paucibacter sp. AS339]|uniref:hypothetical protein n=1 Tax=Paucibacter hankyongi TaxID=3133434 RepID=UPI0030B55C29
MNRLLTELQRLYVPHLAAEPSAGPSRCELLDEQGHLRGFVLELHGPADWSDLAPLWRGVQSELGLPAPAIAVSGTDALQLWFSMAEAITPSVALAFLEGLRCRFLPHLATARWRQLLSTVAWPARELPSGQQWSAFVAPDLAPVFGSEPWLDTPPNPDGQADLLARLSPMKAADFQAALAQLNGAVASATSVSQPVVPVQSALVVASAIDDLAGLAANASAAPAGGTLRDPGEFLLQVMNNESIEMSLRIEAAKALLPWFKGPARR